MKKIYLSLVLLFTCLTGFSQPSIGYSSFITGLTVPVDIANARDGSNRLFIVQQNGIIRVYDGSLLSAPFLNMSSLITYDAGGERGLLSIAFHPQFAANGYFFVYYNNAAGNGELARYHISATDPNVADPASGKILLTVPKPYTNHNGCKLNFGADGYLYLGTGDGGSGGDPQNNAQNLNSLLGKMLRINVDNFNASPYYTIPADNPLVGIPNTRPEIFGWGLRNPWRWSFDRQTNDLWIADVGQGAWEEVNSIPYAGRNGLDYGWRCYEGTHAYDLSQCGATPSAGKTFPIFEYPHNASGGYSITGGLVYRGAEYPFLQGYYICADYVNPNTWLIKADGTGGWTVRQQTNLPAGIVTFGDAENGDIYFATLTSGTVYKITAAVPLPARLLSFSGSMQDNQDILTWRAASDPALMQFELEQSADGRRFAPVGVLKQKEGPAADYTFTAPSLPITRYYRLKLIYSNGTADYSSLVSLKPGKETKIIVAQLTSAQIRITTPAPLESLRLINMEGRLLQRYDDLKAGMQVLDCGGLIPGTYMLQCIRYDRSVEHIRVAVY